MKVIFSHGKESGPNGSKIRRLAHIARDHGCDTQSIDYTDTMDPDQRVERLLQVIQSDDANGLMLVGSSMGGYVSLVASRSVAVKGMFLLAPALYMPGYREQSYETLCPRIEIVHGWSDEVIPYQHSIRFSHDANCSLHLISGDHRLMTVLDQVDTLFQRFLHSVQDN